MAKTVVITGASSGIGRACAKLLADRGFFVFAGVRRDADGARLEREAGGMLTPIELDVTDEGSIRRAVRSVRENLDGNGLGGLVNNAGIGVAAPVEYLSPEALRRQFDVNVFGQIAVTQAFLPLLHRARGRIVNMGSVGSRLSMPFGGALAASKSALNALNDALRLELHPFGIHVSIVEPGAIHTPAAEKMLGNIDATLGALPPEGAARYGEMLRVSLSRGYEHETNGSPPELVAAAVHRALTAWRPRSRYLVGKDARLMAALPRLLPDGLLDRLRYRLFGIPSKFATALGQGRD
jgi:NAD(P)-dependent dehydrogenase (short-subunit alcohol dehydrogenase family)